MSECTCSEDRSARRCGIHTQADFDAADRARSVTVPVPDPRAEPELTPLAELLDAHKIEWEMDEQTGREYRCCTECDDSGEGDDWKCFILRALDEHERQVRAEIARTIVSRIKAWEPTCSEQYIRGMKAALLYVSAEAVLS